MQTTAFTPARAAEKCVSRALGAWARRGVTPCPWLLVVVPLLGFLVLVMMLVGPLKVDITQDPDKMWFTPEDFGIVNRDLHDSEWGRTRPEWVVLTPKSAGANLASKEALQEVFVVEDTVFSLVEQGRTLLPNLTFTLGPGGPPFLLGATCMWGFQESVLANDPEPLKTLAGLLTGSPIAQQCGPAAQQPQMILSDFSVVDGAINSISAFKLWYYLDDSDDRRAAVPGWTDLLEAWEQQFLTSLQALDESGQLQHIRIHAKALRSLPDELASELTHDVPVYIGASCGMLLLLMIDLVSCKCGEEDALDASGRGNNHQLRTVCIASLVMQTMVLALLLSLGGAVALIGATPDFIYTPFSALTVFPVLLIGFHHVKQLSASVEAQAITTRSARRSLYEPLGVADSDTESFDDEYIEIVVRAVSGRWGVGMLCSLIAVVVGTCLVEDTSLWVTLGGENFDNYTDSVSPAIRSMVRYVLYAVLLEHVLMLTVGVGVMVLWIRGMLDLDSPPDTFLPDMNSKALPVSPRPLVTRLLQPWIQRLLSDERDGLSLVPARVLSLTLVAIAVGCGIYGAAHLTDWSQNLQLWELFSSDSRLHDFYTADYEYFRDVGVVLEVNFRSGLDYASPEIGAQVMALGNALATNEYVPSAGPVAVPYFSWYWAFIFTSVPVTAQMYDIPLVNGMFPPADNFTFFFTQWPHQPNTTFNTYAGSFTVLPFGPPPYCPNGEEWYLCTLTRFEGGTVPLITEAQQRDAVESLQHTVHSNAQPGKAPLGTVWFPPWTAYRAYTNVMHGCARALIIGLMAACISGILFLSPVGGIASGTVVLASAAATLGLFMSELGYGVNTLSISILVVLPYVSLDLVIFSLLGTSYRGDRASKTPPIPVAVSHSTSASIGTLIAGLLAALIMITLGMSPITVVVAKIFACSLLFIGCGALGVALLAASARRKSS